MRRFGAAYTVNWSSRPLAGRRLASGSADTYDLHAYIGRTHHADALDVWWPRLREAVYAREESFYCMASEQPLIGATYRWVRAALPLPLLVECIEVGLGTDALDTYRTGGAPMPTPATLATLRALRST